MLGLPGLYRGDGERKGRERAEAACVYKSELDSEETRCVQLGMLTCRERASGVSNNRGFCTQQGNQNGKFQCQ